MVKQISDGPKESVVNKMCKIGYFGLVIAVLVAGVAAIVGKP